MRHTTPLAGALALALAACGTSAKTDPYSEIVPDAAAVTLDAHATPAGELAAAPAEAAPHDPALLTSAVDDLQRVKDRVAELNAGVRHVFERVEEVMQSGGRELPNRVKVWGPAVRCVEPGAGSTCLAQASLRLVVRLAHDRAGGFVLEARSAASAADGDFRPVLAGWLVRGERVRRGAGRLWVNLENLKTAAGAWDGSTGFKGQGYLAAGFAAGPAAKAARYRLLGFTRDLTQRPPVTAAFAGWRSASGVVRVRAAGIGNHDTAGAADELGLWRAVHHPTLGGRAFSAISNFDTGSAIVGDVPTTGTLDHYWFGRACYAVNATTPEYKEWFYCPRSQSPRACILAEGGVGTKVSGTAATWQDSSCDSLVEPDAVKPPAAAPAGPLDDAAEDAEAETGLSPHPAPAPDAVPETAPPG